MRNTRIFALLLVLAMLLGAMALSASAAEFTAEDAIAYLDAYDENVASDPDFAANVDWMKWVCVMPNNAMVAVKDDLVLCLVAEGQLYSLTAIGIEAAGWTVVETLENPN